MKAAKPQVVAQRRMLRLSRISKPACAGQGPGVSGRSRIKGCWGICYDVQSDAIILNSSIRELGVGGCVQVAPVHLPPATAAPFQTGGGKAINSGQTEPWTQDLEELGLTTGGKL